ncbi:JmjC domain-containing protein [Nocardia sp. NPDC052566]|uniref:JmjC domain-containing protein n=1 Tax=Nocardia sp. NPDC052566 TaxID=3364330 RepID=UPI0037CA6DEB
MTRGHFDPVDVVTMQLAGRKTWRIAANTFAPVPNSGFALREPVPTGMRAYASELPPTEMPGNAESYELEAGAILHIPRGYWHETGSDRDSLSLHILLRPTTRLDRALAALRNELIRDESWRTAASALAATDLDALRAAVRRLDPADLGHRVRPDGPIEAGDRVARAGQAALGIDAIAGTTARITVTAFGFHRTRTTTVDLDTVFVPACRWIGALPTGATFGVADLLDRGLAGEQAVSLVRLLEQAGLLRRHP